MNPLDQGICGYLQRSTGKEQDPGGKMGAVGRGILRTIERLEGLDEGLTGAPTSLGVCSFEKGVLWYS